MITGNASAMALHEVVGFLARNGLEGVLKIASPTVRMKVFVKDGRLLCPCRSLPSPPPARRAKRVPRQKPDSGQLKRADLFKLLDRAATLSRRDRVEQVTESLHRALRTDQATYQFEPRTLEAGLVRRLERDGLILDSTALVMEAARRTDEAKVQPRERGSYESRPRSDTRRRRRLVQRRRPRTRMRVLSGDLAGIGLGALLQDLRARRGTGTLIVTARGRTERIRFHEGQAHLLVTRTDGAFARYLLGDSGARTLSGLATRAPHEDCAVLEGRVLDMFFWHGARFSFHAEGEADASSDSAVALDTQRFLLDAMAMMAEWDAIHGVLGGPNAVLHFPCSRQKLACVRQVGDYLTFVDGLQSFDDLVHHSGVDRLEAGRVLARLVEEGVVVRLPPVAAMV